MIRKKSVVDNDDLGFLKETVAREEQVKELRG